MAGRVYRVVVDGVQVGELWTRRPLWEYLRLLARLDEAAVVHVEAAEVGPWRQVGLPDLEE